MNVEQVLLMIELFNNFLSFYQCAIDSDEALFRPIMIRIMELAAKLQLPYFESDGMVWEWLMPTNEQMKEILEKSRRDTGDAG